ncbi:MAG TPA: hypothetical protein DEO32_02195 [Ruminococcaceae bacterium]|nr:hypothetical protein [Oscillospiraceae bacterium]
MTEYVITEENEHGSACYGVSARQDNNEIMTIPGVFETIGEAERAVGLLNGLRVDICHFEDVIEDYLTDFKI